MNTAKIFGGTIRPTRNLRGSTKGFMEAKHTPGPWTVCEHSWSRTGIYSGGKGIAALDIYDDATEETQDECEAVMAANARLIAAAPDLLEALQSYLLPIDTNNIALSCIEFGTEAVEHELKRRAAIAKATGGAV